MKTLIDVILRTLSIIKTHLSMFSNYRNYSLRLQYKGYKGFRNINYDDTTINKILSVIFDDPTENTDTAEIKVIRKSVPKGKKHHYIIETDGMKFYIKAFNNNTLPLLLRDLFRSSKAMKFYACNFEIYKRNIRVPEAVFVLQKKFLLFKIRSIIATEEIKDALPVRNHYKNWGTENDKNTYLKELAHFLYLLNKQKIAHADLLGNVFVKAHNSKLQFFLIDNDAVKLFDNLTQFDYIKHFEGFYDFFVKKEGYSEKDWETLCAEYLKLDPLLSSSIEDLTEQVKNRKNLLSQVINIKL